MADAAQEFLDKQLSKNKFTAKQQSRLDASGGPSVAGFGDGVVPGGSAYAKYGEINAAEKNAASAAESAAPDGFYESGWRSEKDSGEIGWSDTWNDGGNFQQIKGDGKANAAYDERFGALGSTGSDVDDHGAGWKSLKDLPTMGSVDELKSLSAEWEKAGYDVRVQDIEGHNGVSEANIAVRKGSGKDAAPEPAKERTPIEHSPEVKQATERVRAYEDNVMSGKTSENIFGSYDTDLDLNASEAPSAQATPTEQAPAKATASFLESKKVTISKLITSNLKLTPLTEQTNVY